MSLYRNPKSQFWWCRFKIRGRTWRLSTGKTDRREASEAEVELRAEKQRATPQKRRGVGTLQQLAAADADRAERTGSSEAHVRNLTYRAATTILVLDVIDPVDVTADKLNEFVAERRRSGVSGQTIVRELSDIRRWLLDAKERGWISDLPGKWPHVKRDPKDTRKRGKVHSEWETIAMLSCASENLREAAIFCIATGLRFMELQRVEWSWILKAPGGVGVDYMIRLPDWATKGKKERVVGLPDFAMEIAKKRHRLHGEQLFPQKNYARGFERAKEKAYGWTVAHIKNQKKRKTALLEAVAEIPNLTLRDMRHTFATKALEKTGNLSAVMAALGHSKPETTWIYITPQIHATLGLVGDVGVTPKVPHHLFSERETGFEPATFSLGSSESSEKTSAEPVSLPQENTEFVGPLQEMGDTPRCHTDKSLN